MIPDLATAPLKDRTCATLSPNLFCSWFLDICIEVSGFPLAGCCTPMPIPHIGKVPMDALTIWTDKSCFTWQHIDVVESDTSGMTKSL